jgi:hypothetical protein
MSLGLTCPDRVSADGQERGPDVYALFGLPLSFERSPIKPKGTSYFCYQLCVQQEVNCIVYGTSLLKFSALLLFTF